MTAAAVCLRRVGHCLEVLLVRTSDHRRYTFPKGKVETEETAWNAAVRELAEEAGYTGFVKTTPVHHHTTGEEGNALDYYLIREAVKITAGEPGRKPCWFGLDEAAIRLRLGRTDAEVMELLVALRSAAKWYCLH
jgi:8-oxo-dGTP pyrophosphatase MutT (NUDIX family)